MQRLLITMSCLLTGISSRVLQDNMDSIQEGFAVGLLIAASKFDQHAISQIMLEVFSEVADAVKAAEIVGLRADWFDKVIGKVQKAKDHQKHAYTSNSIRENMEYLQRQLDMLADKLKQAEDMMVDQYMEPFGSGDYVVQCFGGNV